MLGPRAEMGGAYWVAVGTVLFKNSREVRIAEGRNIFTHLPNLSLGEFKQLVPVHFFYSPLSFTYS